MVSSLYGKLCSIYRQSWNKINSNSRSKIIENKIKAIEVIGSNDSHDSNSNHEAEDMSYSVRATRNCWQGSKSNCTKWLQDVQ